MLQKQAICMCIWVYIYLFLLSFIYVAYISQVTLFVKEYMYF